MFSIITNNGNTNTNVIDNKYGITAAIPIVLIIKGINNLINIKFIVLSTSVKYILKYTKSNIFSHNKYNDHAISPAKAHIIKGTINVIINK